MILGKWPAWRTILLYVFIFILTLYMFQAYRAHHQERQIVSIQPLVTVTLCRWPYRLQVGNELATCRWHGHRQLPEVVLTQFVSPDDEHDVLETCRELKIKINTYKRIVRHAGHLPRTTQKQKILSYFGRSNSLNVSGYYIQWLLQHGAIRHEQS
jgi:hypothetical protein